MKKFALLLTLVVCLAMPAASFGKGPDSLPMTITNNRGDGYPVFFRVNGHRLVLNDGCWWTGPSGTVDFQSEVGIQAYNLPPYANASFFFDANSVLCLNW